MRRSGILLSLTSLSSAWGIGTMGRAAREFVDFLAASGQTVWQLLPLGPTGYGDSPYQVFSTFAGNPYLIDLDDLEAEGLLRREEYEGLPWGDDPLRVDYAALYEGRRSVLGAAVARLREGRAAELAAFCARESAWLEDYALFMAIKDSRGGAPWTAWPEPLKRREAPALDEARRELSERIELWKGVQCLFFRQWDRLRAYAARAGVLVMGDIPIYVAPGQRGRVGAPRAVPARRQAPPHRGGGLPPRQLCRGRPALGQPALRLGAHGPRRLRVVGRARVVPAQAL